MSHYELTYIIPASITENECPAIEQQVKDILVKKLAGTITKETILGRKKLAYDINKEKHGYYVTVEFDCEPAQIIELDKQLTLHNSILRHLVVSKKMLTPEEEEAKATKRAKRQVKRQVADRINTHKDKAAAPVKDTAPKISLDKLDEKLDELLGQDIN